MKRVHQVLAGLILLTAAPLWAQVGIMTAQSGSMSGDQMQTPPPVSGQAFSTEFTSEERSNYLRGGIAFLSAYTDNALGDVNGRPESDISYTVMPTVAWDRTTSRLNWVLSYAPGFTFYQRNSSRNEADQNASINFEYRLSPHVTLSAGDGFQKSSNVFNQLNPTSAAPVTGGSQDPNFSVFAPIADRLTNSANVGITYQFGLNGMMGASGSFGNLHYPYPTQVSGLYDSAGQAGGIFMSFRASQMHYFGATYQYQRLLSYPSGISNETQTQAALFFYSFLPTKRLSFSLFGGPQYSDSSPISLPQQSTTPEAKAWTPAVGASWSWRGRVSSFAMSYSHVISGGGGLYGAVHMDNASANVRQKITKALSGSLVGGYTNNNVLAGSIPFSNNGHTIQGTATLQQQFGQSLSLILGYTRLHQTYANVQVISQTPDTNREFVSLSYQFSRPLGR